MPPQLLARLLLKYDVVSHFLAEPSDVKFALEVEEILEVVKLLLSERRYEYAVQLLEVAKRYHFSSFKIREKLALVFWDCDKRTLAKLEVDELRKVMAETSDNLEQLSKTYFRIGMVENSEVVARRLLALYPDQVSARRTLIDIFLTKGRFVEIYDELSAVSQHLCSNASDLMFAAKTFLRLGDIAEQKLSMYHANPKLLSHDDVASTRRYLSSRRRLDASEASILAERALKGGYDPQILARSVLVEALLHAGKKRKATKELNGLLSQAESSDDVARGADLWLKLGRKDQALITARHGVKLRPVASETSLARLTLSDVFLACDSLNEAQSLLNEIVIPKLQSIDFLKRFHETAFRSLLHKAALASAERILEIQPYTQYYMDRVTILKMIVTHQSI